MRQWHQMVTIVLSCAVVSGELKMQINKGMSATYYAERRRINSLCIHVTS